MRKTCHLHRLCLGLVVLALGVLGGGAVFAMPVRPPVGLFAVTPCRGQLRTGIG